MKKSFQIIFFLFFASFISAQQTEVQYLSGTGLGNETTWKFYCSAGMNSGKWSKIKVPAQWEIQGFGEYTYGRWYKAGLKNPSMEEGKYEYSFSVPASWKNKQVTIVFEGVMTDTEVKINGLLAGEIHQGGFYRFSYNITDKLKIGGKNKLEVKVSKHSANKSVNAAERRADWWLFGGIYRPVYLEAKPQINIERIAVNAQADGKLSAEIFTTSLPQNYKLVAGISHPKMKIKFNTHNINLEAGATKHNISVKWDNVLSWNTENPQLYRLTLELKNEQNQTVHTFTERIGFRTIEFRKQDGIYVNGVKVVLKGTNRHSSHPDGGRTTNREISLQDAKLLKEMNMNAVRSHYPPDKHFLDMCDSLGIFYLNELAGWQNAYDTEVGRKLVKEMVVRDVNHPCIILWNNGNEGGWNTALDNEFAKYDPQKRHVIHPWADFDDLDTHHYPAYQTGVARFTNGFKVFMPAEFAHGLYDQGNGAGMEDFWLKWIESPLFAGAFTWCFADEAVKRSDKGGILDSDGSNAPDGIFGPYREKEGSFYTIREIWSPVQIRKFMITPSFNGELFVTNDYLFSTLGKHTLKYRLYSIASPLTESKKKLVEEGQIILPDIARGETAKIKLPVSELFFKANVLELEAMDGNGSSVCNWTVPVQLAATYTAEQIKSVNQEGAATYELKDSTATLLGGVIKVQFNLNTGLITEVKNKCGLVSFNNGPVAVGMKIKLKEHKIRQEGDKSVLTFFYLGGVDSIRWEMTPSGLFHMSAIMLNRASGGTGFDDSFMEENITNFGLTFSYPENRMMGMEWFGRGPYRVWKNRIKGTNYGLWNKEYNNTITGESFESLVYPEFKGYHANMYWATMQTKESIFSFYSESDGLFLRVFTPEEPKKRLENSMPAFPGGDISFLYEIPAIRDFKPIPHLGPNSQPASVRIKKGDEGISMKIWFDFRAP
ncbi:MAG TPA: glycoside hydrolase family 2 TIM barrel-domain containing protein [Paludibacter sp.]|nr:glycoside hydrolase family 2 TIM barrel-domain containing protein [Paludibacter sp.]